jgi:hypothetical protein
VSAVTRGATGPGMAGRVRELAPSLLAGFLLPAVVYWLVRPHVGGDAAALAIGGAVPALWTVLRLAFWRRVDPAALVGTAAFAGAAVVSVLTGGSSLPLKLHDAVVTGALGLACLVSVAIRRPLLGLLGRRLGTPHALGAGTAIAGVTLIVHAAAHTLVALALPTSSYVIVSRVVGLPIYAAGALALIWYLRRQAAA